MHLLTGLPLQRQIQTTPAVTPHLMQLPLALSRSTNPAQLTPDKVIEDTKEKDVEAQ